MKPPNPDSLGNSSLTLPAPVPCSIISCYDGAVEVANAVSRYKVTVLPSQP